MAAGLIVRANMPRKHRPDSEVAAFIKELYKAAGYSSWAEFAREANVIPASLSHWKDGNTQISGPNLVKLIQAAKRRRDTSLDDATDATDPVRSMYERVVQEQMPAIERAAQDAGDEGRKRALDVRKETLQLLRGEVAAMLDEQTKEVTRALRALAREVRAQAPEPARAGRRAAAG